MERGDHVERQARAAHNQSLFRSVNEKLQGLADAFEYIAAQPSSFACECADTSCIEEMSLSLPEYEAVRAHPNHFTVLPGHVDLDVERVVAENERFIVVEKVGTGAEIARALHPRLAR